MDSLFEQVQIKPLKTENQDIEFINQESKASCKLKKKWVKSQNVSSEIFKINQPISQIKYVPQSMLHEDNLECERDILNHEFNVKKVTKDQKRLTKKQFLEYANKCYPKIIIEIKNQKKINQQIQEKIYKCKKCSKLFFSQPATNKYIYCKKCRLINFK